MALTDSAWESARQMVSATLGASIHPVDNVEPKYIGMRSRVARVRLGNSDGGSETLVIKQRYVADGSPYDPLDRAPGSLSTRVAYEAAALQLLGNRSPRRLAPQLIGVDYNTGVLVMEDIGEGPGLLEHLLGNDPVQADRALHSYATGMGRLHAAGAGHADEFAAILGQFGPRPINPLPAAIAGYAAEFERAIHALGMAIPPDVRSYLDQGVARMRSPRGFLSLTHGDICPGHDRIVDDHSIFIDLELAGFRHALYDLAYLFVPFPFCGFAGRLPPQSQANAVTAYRTVVAQAIPGVADDEQFHPELAYAWIFWIVRNLGTLLPHALHDDTSWGTTTFRQRLIQQCQDLAASPHLELHFPAVTEWVAGVSAAMRAIWPDTAPMPPYPAYRAVIPD